RGSFGLQRETVPRNRHPRSPHVGFDALSSSSILRRVCTREKAFLLRSAFADCGCFDSSQCFALRLTADAVTQSHQSEGWETIRRWYRPRLWYRTERGNSAQLGPIAKHCGIMP